MIEDTYISSLISKRELERTLRWIEETKERQCRNLGGGQRETVCLNLRLLQMLIPHLKVSCQEVFAPIVVVNKVKSIEEAVE